MGRYIAPAQKIKIVFNTCATDHDEVETLLVATLNELGFRHVGAGGGSKGCERYILFDRDLTCDENSQITIKIGRIVANPVNF